MSGPLSPALAARTAATSAGVKLFALMALGTSLLLLRSPETLAPLAGIALIFCLAIVGPKGLRTGFPAALLIAIAALSAFTFYFEDARAAVAVVLRLVALILFALIVTGTTRASEVQDALVAALRPFEWLPFVSAEKTGLALAITLRSLPRLGAALQEIRQAQGARGLALSPITLVIPLVARMLRDAREIADAIDARSWSGDKPGR